MPEVILDEGVVGPPPQERDFQFEADSPTERHLTPANGSEVAIVGTAPVGRNGCEDASLSANRIDIGSGQGRNAAKSLEKIEQDALRREDGTERTADGCQLSRCIQRTAVYD